jgi:diguanylate cyclase (GGDEF)-like protein
MKRPRYPSWTVGFVAGIASACALALGAVCLKRFIGPTATHSALWPDLDATALAAPALLVLASLVVALAVAISAQRRRNRRLSLELAALRRSDALTSLHNGRAFRDAVEQEWQRSQRNHQPLSLLMFDFGSIAPASVNSRHDRETIIAIARCIESCLRRPADTVVRFSELEFAVMLPETDAHGAWVVSDKIRRFVESLGAGIAVGIGSATSNRVAHPSSSSLFDAARSSMHR